MLNKIVLMGRLTRDPELRHTSTGVPVTSFSLACERDFRAQGEERQTDFFDVVCWRHNAEFTAKWFRKGLLVAVAGRLQTRKWVDKEGQNRTGCEIVADETHFAERRQDNPNYEMPPHPAERSMPPASRPAVPAQEAPQAAALTSTFAELEDDDGDLPF
jgi:single-strand DNA-binding protein